MCQAWIGQSAGSPSTPLLWEFAKRNPKKSCSHEPELRLSAGCGRNLLICRHPAKTGEWNYVMNGTYAIFALLNIATFAAILIASSHVQISWLPKFHGNLSGAFGLAVLIDAAFFCLGRLFGKALKAVGLDANRLDEESPPRKIVVFYLGLNWLIPAALLALISFVSPSTLSLAGAALGGVVWLVIREVLAFIIEKVFPQRQSSQDGGTKR